MRSHFHPLTQTILSLTQNTHTHTHNFPHLRRLGLAHGPISRHSANSNYTLHFIKIQTLTLGREPPVTCGIPAVIIKLVVLINPRHRRVLLAAQPGGGAVRIAGGGAAVGAAVGVATVDLEVFVFSDKGLVVVVSFVFSILGGPW